MLRKRLFVTAAAGLAAMVLFVPPARAIFGRQFTVKELTELADLIVVGSVSEVRSFWNEEHNRIYTGVTVSIDREGGVVKTDGVHRNGDDLTLKILGGSIPADGICNYIPGMPQFAAGERVLVFIRNDNEFCPVLGCEQGKRSPEEPGLKEEIVKYLP